MSHRRDSSAVPVVAIILLVAALVALGIRACYELIRGLGWLWGRMQR